MADRKQKKRLDTLLSDLISPKSQDPGGKYKDIYAVFRSMDEHNPDAKEPYLRLLSYIEKAGDFGDNLPLPIGKTPVAIMLGGCEQIIKIGFGRLKNGNRNPITPANNLVH